MTDDQATNDPTSDYQSILNQYAADLQKVRGAQEPPEVIPPIPTPTPSSEPILPPLSPLLPLPPTPVDQILPPVTAPPTMTAADKFFRIFFFISLFIFLGICTALAVTFLNSPNLKPTALRPVIPTAALSATPTPSEANFCLLNDQKYLIGQSFSAADGCNTCTCTPQLTIDCTSKTCASYPSLDWKTYSNKSLGFAVEFPKTWTGQYTANITKDGVSFNYALARDTSGKYPAIFSISRLSLTDWDNAIADTASPLSNIKDRLIKKSPDFAYYYSIALSNDLTGKNADNFSKMAGDVKSIVDTFKLL